MFNPNDRFQLGVIAGIVANIPKSIFTWTFYLLRFNKYTMWHIAASTFFPQESVTKLIPLLIGAIADYSVSTFLGIFILYLLYFTGLKHPLLKGIVAALFFWVTLYGTIVGSNITSITPTSIATNVIQLIDHIILGLLIPLIIIKYGKELLIKE